MPTLEIHRCSYLQVKLPPLQQQFGPDLDLLPSSHCNILLCLEKTQTEISHSMHVYCTVQSDVSKITVMQHTAFFSQSTGGRLLRFGSVAGHLCHPCDQQWWPWGQSTAQVVWSHSQKQHSWGSDTHNCHSWGDPCRRSCRKEGSPPLLTYKPLHTPLYTTM